MPIKRERHSADGVPERLVLQQLDRMLESPVFMRAEQVSRLLRFIVERRLAGRAADLREKEIACQVYGRDPAGFQPEVDNVVRAAARRLRNALREYYSEFLDHLVVISLAPGRYVPAFRLTDSGRRALAEEGAGGEKQEEQRGFIRLRSSSLTLSGNQARLAIIRHDFYCAEWNETGKGVTHDYRVKVLDEAVVVLDQATGLMWDKAGAEDCFTYERTGEYISKMNAAKYAGFDDWRLPTLEEAMSLVTAKQGGKRIELVSGEEEIVYVLHLDELFGSGRYLIWTSDTYEDPRYAWVVIFLGGRCGIERREVSVPVIAVRPAVT
jgi:hypothetical protein